MVLVLLVLSLSFAGGRKPPKEVPSPGSQICGGKNSCVCILYPGQGAVISLSEEINFEWRLAESFSYYEIYIDGVKEPVTLGPGTTRYSIPACWAPGTHTWKLNAFGGNGTCYGSVTATFKTCNPYFIDFRDFIIRKGAIRSYKGEKMLIPFNPRDGILICEGKSNPAWNYSSPHGCGRIMSRSQANKVLTDEQVNNAMEGVFASNKPKDESPLAYKSAALIESCIGETVTILNRIKPIMNMKAG